MVKGMVKFVVVVILVIEMIKVMYTFVDYDNRKGCIMDAVYRIEEVLILLATIGEININADLINSNTTLFLLLKYRCLQK